MPLPIERSLQRIQGMRNLIMDLLDFTKIKLERKDEKIEEVHLSNIASNAIVTVRPYAIQMEVSVNLGIKIGCSDHGRSHGYGDNIQ